MRRAGVNGAAREAFREMLVPSDPAPPAELVPKPSVAAWKPVSLNFGGIGKSTAAATPAAPSAAPEVTSAASTTASSTPAAPVPNAFAKPPPFSFSSAIGKPPAPAASEEKKDPKTADSSASKGDSSTDKSESTPLVTTGFKFGASTTWLGLAKKTGDASAASAEDSGKPAPATTMKWNFLGKSAAPAATAASTAAASDASTSGASFKPSLSTHFGKSASGAAAGGSFSGFKTNFQFGKDVQPPKASEPNKQVLESLDKTSSATDSAKALVDSAPVVTLTGDEGEDTLFKADAKLSEIDIAKGEWIERGVGSFKINQLKDETKTNKIDKYRMLMHVKTTLKLIVNSFIYVGMTAELAGEGPSPVRVKFSATPVPVAPKPSSSSEEGKDDESSKTPAAPQPAISVFALRFRDAETAALCLKTMKDAIAAKSAKKDGDEKTEEKSTPASTTESKESKESKE